MMIPMSNNPINDMTGRKRLKYGRREQEHIYCTLQAGEPKLHFPEHSNTKKIDNSD